MKVYVLYTVKCVVSPFEVDWALFNTVLLGATPVSLPNGIS